MNFYCLNHALRFAFASLFVFFAALGYRCAAASGQFSVSIDSSLGEILATTCDPIAKYYFEHYRHGERSSPKTDGFLSRLETYSIRNLATSKSPSISFDLRASMIAHSLESKLQTEHPQFYESLQSVHPGACDEVQISEESLAAFHRIILVPGATRTRNKIIYQGNKKFLAVCNQYGLEVQTVDAPEFPHIDHVTNLVCRKIQQCEQDGKPYVVVSMSCGCPATLMAIHRLGPDYLKSCKGVISVSGIPNGTSLADDMNTFPYRALSFFPLRKNGIDPKNIASMSASRLSGLHNRLTLPDSIPFIYLVPIPLESTIGEGVRKSFEHMRKDGLNDGLVHTHLAVVDHGIVVPVLGTDHSFSNRDHARLGVTAINALASFLGKQL